VLGHESFDANGDTTNRIISIYHLGVNTSTNLPSWLFLTATTVQ
jgi:hypothetical protein